jgi:branched-subunit amino acid aminotransferase/4-amino-4-deoxychorismate lyase
MLRLLPDACGCFTQTTMGERLRDWGAQYPILTDSDANLTEGSGFNIVLVKDGKLFTPKRGVLEGVSRETVVAVSVSQRARMARKARLRSAIGSAVSSVARQQTW